MRLSLTGLGSGTSGRLRPVPIASQHQHIGLAFDAEVRVHGRRQGGHVGFVVDHVLSSLKRALNGHVFAALGLKAFL